MGPAFAAWQKQIEGYAAFAGKLAESPKTLAACLEFDLAVDRAGDRLGTYAMLKTVEDQANGTYQRMQGRFARRPAAWPRPPVTSTRKSWPFRRLRWSEFLQDPALCRTSFC